MGVPCGLCKSVDRSVPQLPYLSNGNHSTCLLGLLGRKVSSIPVARLGVGQVYSRRWMSAIFHHHDLLLL